MYGSTTSLGRCPNCRADVPTTKLLIEFETGDGHGQYAECPRCGDVVDPQ